MGPTLRNPNQKSSEALLSLCQASNWAPDPKQVEELVKEGADIYRTEPSSGNSILLELTFNNQAESVRACVLHTPLPIHFTKKEGPWQRTFLHDLIDYKVEVEASIDILKAVVQRLAEKREGDVADWSAKDKWGLTVISTMAYRSKLSYLWPLVRNDVAYFAERKNKSGKHSKSTSPLIPRMYIFEKDWSRMTPEEQQELL